MEAILSAVAKDGLLLTGLTTEEVVRSATISQIGAVVFVRGKGALAARHRPGRKLQSAAARHGLLHVCLHRQAIHERIAGAGRILVTAGKGILWGTFTIAELQAVREKAAARLNEPDVFHLLICGGTGCHATGSLKLKTPSSRALPQRRFKTRSRCRNRMQRLLRHGPDHGGASRRHFLPENRHEDIADHRGAASDQRQAGGKVASTRIR